MPNLLSPRDLVSRPDRIDELVPHIMILFMLVYKVCLSSQHNFLTVEIFLHAFRAGGKYQV